ncbi:MAG TPA: branched-chain amino acid ABC transporter permease [Thermodesulfobacteriota bacterium]|nr:branched-chain amino acid ABC transporter permease [Thermodesulfobacteriota bacterium]
MRPSTKESISKGTNLRFILIGMAILLLGVFPLLIRNDFYLDGLILIFIWGAFAGAWNILAGYGGMMSLGHNAFFGIGAYTSTLLLLHFGLTPWIGMLVGGLLASCVGLVLGVVCFRLRSHYFALATLAFGEVGSILAVNWRSLTGGSEGLALPIQPSVVLFSFSSKLPYVYTGLFFFLVVIAVSYAVEHSRLGYYLTAFRENEDAARALGVRTGRVRLMAMALSSFLSAIIGTFYAQYVVFIDPTSVIRIQISVQVALFAIVGGIGTALGPAIGALIFVPITILLRAKMGTSLPGLHMIIYGIILVLVLLYMPQGVATKLRERIPILRRI